MLQVGLFLVREVSEFSTDSELDVRERLRGLGLVLLDGMTTQAMMTLARGPLLVTLALAVGVSNLGIGLLAALAPIVQLVQLPAVYLVERVGGRRRIGVLVPKR